MNREFLYKKPSVLGVIDDTPVSLESWFLDNSRDLMEQKFKESSLYELILEVTRIFCEGTPNYKVLLGLFGSGVLKNAVDQQTIYSLRKLERLDIDKIELHVDNESLIICKICLYVTEFPFPKTVREKISEQLTNVSFLEKSNGFVIMARDTEILVLKA